MDTAHDDAPTCCQRRHETGFCFCPVCEACNGDGETRLGDICPCCIGSGRASREAQDAYERSEEARYEAYADRDGDRECGRLARIWGWR